MTHMCVRSMRQRIGSHLNMHGARLRALAALFEPWRAVAVRGPKSAALPAGGRVVDAPIQALREKAQRIRTSLSALAGIWAVITALACAILVVLAINYGRLPTLRETLDAGANASVLPALSVASLVGFGAVVVEMPAFAMVRDWVLAVQGGPLVSLAVATNVLAALTGSASGGLTIALDALAGTYMTRATEIGIDPALLHRVAVIASGTLDSLPHNGAVVTLLAVCGSSHRESYRDIVMVGIVSAIIALAAVIVLGSVFGSF